MATNLRSLVVSLVANTVKYQQGMSQADKALTKFGKTQKAGLSLVTKGLASLGAAAGGVSFTRLIRGAIDSANHLGDMSARIGISTEALSELGYVAETSGVSLSTLEMSLQRMTRRTAEAAKGTGEASKALQELDISAKELSALAPEEQFEVLADALANTADEGNRLALAVKLFDSSGAAMLQMMTEGAAGLREWRVEAQRLGLSIGQDTADAATQFNKNMIIVKSNMEGITNQLTAFLLPALLKFTTLMRQVVAPTEFEEIVTLTKKISALQNRQVPPWWSDEKVAKKLNEALAERAVIIERIQQQLSSPAPQLGGADPLVGGGAAGTAAAAKATAAAAAAAAAKASREKEAREREKQYLIAQAQMVEDSLKSNEQRLADSYERRKKIVEDAQAADIANKEKYNKILLKLDEKYEKDKIDLAEMTASQEASLVGGLFGKLATLTESGNGRLLEIHRAAAIVDIGISGAVAAMKAYKELGIYGGPAAGLIAGITAVQIAEVAAMRQLGGPVIGGRNYVVGESGPEIFTAPPGGGNIIPNTAAGNGGGVTVNIIEDKSRAGTVEQSIDGSMIDVFVSAAMASLNEQVDRGTGVGSLMDRRYLRGAVG